MSNDAVGGRIDAILARRGSAEVRSAAAPKRPRTGVAVLTCMDARLDVHRILGLTEGDAHVIRNAGGGLTDDVILALAVSQRLLDTREILVLHHLDCAMRHVCDDELAAAVEHDTGYRPPWRFEACSDPARRVRGVVRRLACDPYLAHTELVRGCLYDEHTGTLSDICRASPMTGPRIEVGETMPDRATSRRG